MASGRPPRLLISGCALVSALATSLLVSPPRAQAVLPLPTYPDCGKDGTAANCPPDLTKSDGSLNGDAWAWVNFIPPEVRHVRKQEVDMGSGTSSTTAWQTTTGRFDVKIAVLDCGIRWGTDSLINKVALNTGELPLPLGADGKICSSFDCDHNGLVNVQDYADDSRVSISAGDDRYDDKLETSDLIATFSDGVDDDDDGYEDNIAGWDFFWDNNDPYTSNDFYHMSYVLEDAAGEGGEQDSSIGHCPNCSILPVRISDSFVGEGDKIAEGIVYAVDHGAQVIGMALGSMSNPEILQSAMQYAWDHDVTIVAAAGDELGYHHNYPGANDFAVYVHSIHYYPIASLESASTMIGFYGCNNFGARLDAVAPSGGCATGSVAAITGIAGLMYSRARDLGIDLTASEARQLLLRNVDDINVPESQKETSVYFPSHPGWDLFFGYGRVNAGRTVSKVAEGTIPPEIELASPAWFEYIDPRTTSTLAITGEVAARRSGSYNYQVDWAPGVDPAEGDYTILTSRLGLTSPLSGTLATFDLSKIDPAVLDAQAPLEPLEGTDSILDKQAKLNARGITLRVTVTDAEGNVAQERKQVFLIEDPDLLPGFPLELGHSGEASPVLYDLNRDGKQEIVVATSNGEVHAYTSTGAELSGWPVKVGLLNALDPANPDNHLEEDGYASGEVSSQAYQGIVGAPAVGDMENDGIPEVVVATLEGKVYAFTADGKLKSGFPVARDAVDDADTDPHSWLDPGMFASTVLYDLDNDGRLEIIQASMDQKVYVWRATGARVSGFPVKLENPDGSTGVSTLAGRIVSSPAIGDLDGDGQNEIVVGANEYDEENVWEGFAYAIHGDGNSNPMGPILPGWPIQINGLLGGVIMYIGEGTTISPSLADVDGDGTLEIAISGVASIPQLFSYDGREFLKLGCSSKDFGKNANTNDSSFWAVISNASFADFDGDGDLDVMMPGSGLSFFVALGLSQYMKWDHLAAAWDARTGRMLDGFPRVTEDISFFNTSVAGDISGDGLPEMITGTSGYALHAFDPSGNEPAGWPKFTGGWMIASPAVGDIDGDGYNEVVQLTREGYLFAWNTEGQGGLEWPTFRHDPQNSGNYHTVPEYNAFTRAGVDRTAAATAEAEADGKVTFTASCSYAAGTGRPVGRAGLWLTGLAAGLAVLRARRRS